MRYPIQRDIANKFRITRYVCGLPERRYQIEALTDPCRTRTYFEIIIQTSCQLGVIILLHVYLKLQANIAMMAFLIASDALCALLETRY